VTPRGAGEFGKYTPEVPRMLFIHLSRRVARVGFIAMTVAMIVARRGVLVVWRQPAAAEAKCRSAPGVATTRA